MKRVLLAAFLLGICIASGTAAQRLESRSGTAPLEAARFGLERIRFLLSDFLYIRIDQYFHMAMFRGEDWRAEADYMPLVWLVVRLRPDFEPVYADGASQLAVNLGLVDQGVALLEEGMRNCPRSLEMRWENLTVRWQSGAGTAHDRIAAGIGYLDFVRRNFPCSPPSEHERNAAAIISWIAEGDSARRATARIASLYQSRWRIMFCQQRIWQDS